MPSAITNIFAVSLLLQFLSAPLKPGHGNLCLLIKDSTGGKMYSLQSAARADVDLKPGTFT